MNLPWKRKSKGPVYPRRDYWNTLTKKKQRVYYESLLLQERAAQRRATDRWLGEATKVKALEKELEKYRESA